MENETSKDKRQDRKGSAPYYDRRPEFGRNGPSKLREKFEQGMTFFLVIGACVVFYFALLRMNVIVGVVRKIFDILKPVLYGLAIAYLLNPVVKRIDAVLVPQFEKKMNRKKAEKFSRGIAIVLSLILMVMVIVALLNMLLPELYKSIRDLVTTLPGQISGLMEQLNHIQSKETATGLLLKTIVEQGGESVTNWLKTDLMGQINTLMSNLTVGVFNIISGVSNLLIGVIVSVYVLFSKEKFSAQCKKMVYAFMKNGHANMLLHLTKKTNEIFGGFFIGKIVDSLIIGILCFIGLSILNMPYTLLVSVVVGVTNIIPFFGPYIGAIPSAVLIILADPMKGVYFIIFILCLQQLDGNVIGPKILGDSTGLSPFWIIFSILLGGGLFGFVGMIMGVPAFAVIYYIVRMLTDQRLEKKNLPLPSEEYDAMSYVDDEGNFVGENPAQPLSEEKLVRKEGK